MVVSHCSASQVRVNIKVEQTVCAGYGLISHGTHKKPSLNQVLGIVVAHISRGNATVLDIWI